MKKYFSVLIIIILVFGFLLPRQASQASSLPAMRVLSAMPHKIDGAVQPGLNAMQAGDMLTVIVTLRQQADLTKVTGADRAARQQGVIRALQATANATHGPVAALLKAAQAQGLVQKYSDLWIFNGFSVTATNGVINALANHADVYSITSDSVDIIPALGAAEWNVAAINAPALWSQGYTGQGVVVANLDTGVDSFHPDLASRYRGGTNSWYDPYGQHATPYDPSGHGTWTTGIMVGGDAGGTTVGVAPGAQWIAAKIFRDAGNATATGIHQSFQWVLNPDGNIATADAPNVVNNSWTYGTPGCNLTFEPDLQALRAAGILPIFAAGNAGPGSNTSYSPANNPSAFAVGAIDNTNTIYALSSRGPTTCGDSTGPYPELVAPGVNINTTGLFGGYYIDSGTSFAAPHVAGALALLLSAYPNLSAGAQEQALKNSAIDLGAAGPDDIYGYGRLDVLAAFNYVPIAPTLTPTATATSVPPTATPTATATSIPPTPTRTPTATAVPTTLHVGDIDGSSTRASNNWTANVIVYVHNASHGLVSGAKVSVTWSGGVTGSTSCTTNTGGYCTISKSKIGNTTTSVVLTVIGVSKSGYTYQASANHDPDGDSSGTGITVLR